MQVNVTDGTGVVLASDLADIELTAAAATDPIFRAAAAPSPWHDSRSDAVPLAGPARAPAGPAAEVGLGPRTRRPLAAIMIRRVVRA